MAPSPIYDTPQSGVIEAGLDFMSEYMEGLEPCYFPSLSHGLTANRDSYSSTLVPFGVESCHAALRTPFTPIRVAWALVLRSFVGRDDVCFWERTAEVETVCRVRFNDSHRISDVVRIVGKDDRLKILHRSRLPTLDRKELSNTAITNDLRDAFDSGEHCIIVCLDFNKTHPSLILRYKNANFSQSNAENVAHTFAKALELVFEESDQNMASTNILSVRDSEQVWSWNSEIPETVSSRSESEAICAWDGTLTYGELNSQASILAHHLQSLGVGVETMVPLCFEKSRWTVVAQLAVLKAGGACVSVDCATPPDRLSTILESTQANVAITTTSHAQMFEVVLDCTVILSQSLLDNLSRELLSNCRRMDSVNINPHNAAFVVFTSGSTGVPKGIVTEHRAICTSARHHGKAMRFNSKSRVLQFAAYTFDVSISDTFVTLVHGGCVCIPSEDDRKGHLASFINSTKVNSMCLTSTVIDFLSPSEIPNVRTLTLGGEPLRKENLSWADNTYLGNVYGPAEASVWCVYKGGLKQTADPMNIGSAVGCRAWIANAKDHHRLVPIGCIGELLLEGPILARGYLRDPTKTAAAFIDNPLWMRGHRTNSRLYKTGDLARFNADGTITFAGRSDTQVKMHGQRIELGDIQYHIQQNTPDSCKVAVDVISSEGEKHMLAAFISLDGLDSGGNTGQQMEAKRRMQDMTPGLQAKLAQALPSYMIPSAYISIPQLPQTASGKLDRKSLRQIGSKLTVEELFSPSDSEATSERTLTPLERRLSILWGSVLGIESSALNDNSNFTKLGGDSLGAIKLVAATRQDGLKLNFVDVIRHHTLSAMAECVEIMHNTESMSIPPFSLLPKEISLNDMLAEVSHLCEVPQKAIEDVYPCTPLQEGIVALSQKHLGSYIGRHVLKLPPDTDLVRFRRAWEAVVEASDALRSRIVHTSHGFLQTVVQHSIQWSESNSVENYVENDEAKPMYPGSPLVRNSIITTSEGFYFVLTIHHAIYDGWSLAKVFELIDGHYNCSVAELRPTPFNRFITHLQLLDVESVREFWTSQLKGFTSPQFPKLPSPNYTPQTDNFVIRQVPLLHNPNITVSTLVRAAWAVLLAKYQGVDDVAFGATVAGRNVSISGIDTIQGPTITTVPIRARIQGQQMVTDLVDQLQEQSMDMLPFEHAGLQNIRRICSEGQTVCDFQSLVVVHPGSEVANEHHQFALHGDQEVIAKAYALMLECTPSADGLYFRASFDSSVIDIKKAQRMLGQLDHLISQMSQTEANIKLDDLDLISPGDAIEIAEWNNERPPAYQSCVQDLISEQATSTPDAVAVCAWDGELSYRRLDDLSSTLAYHLKLQGVGPEVFVPLCFEKSLWAIVAELAVLKAGGACVSVDPSHPIPRLRYIFEDVKATLVVTTPFHAHMFENLSQEMVLVSGNLFTEIPQRPGFSCSLVRPINAAFVVFTSGSTGAPKGICQDHAAYCTNVRLQGPIIGASPGRRVLQFAAHTFDAYLSDIITTLAYGGCCCVPSETDRLNDLPGVINRMRVNQSLFTPSVVKLLNPAEVPTLKVLILSGEVLETQNLRTWADKVHLINLYGPAECTIWATYSDHVRPDSDPRNIGRGIGALMWITEPTNPNRLVPIGAIGELLIDGEGLARGYMNAKEKTDRAFIGAPPWLSNFGSQPSRKLYRTGDLVKYNADGSIHIIGRRDTQVKLRGQRVELSEIEHHLGLHVPTSVAQFAVEVINPVKNKQEQNLSAFVSPKSDYKDTAQTLAERVRELCDGLRAKLLDRLPPFMIPTAFIPIREMPLTIHSKVDRAKLRAHGSEMSVQELAACSTPESSVEFKCTTDMEITLRDLWAKVLQIDSSMIGANKNFIALGGDSIRAMTLVACARNIGISLSVAHVFRSPMLQDMAKICRSSLLNHFTGALWPQSTAETKAEENIPAFSLMGGDKTKVLSEVRNCSGLASANIEDIYPATAMQEALMVMTMKQPGSYTGQYVFRLPTQVEVKRLQMAWDTAFKKNAILRTRMFQFAQFGTLQVVTKTKIDWQLRANLKSYIDEDEASQFSLGQPLARFAVIESGEIGCGYFVLTLHHAVYDGWSLPALFQDIDYIYNQLPTSKPVDFKHFMEYHKGLDDNVAGDYWRSELQGTQRPSFPQLPSKAYQNAAHEHLYHRVSLRHEAAAGVTAANSIYAAWAMLMARYSESNDIVFGAIVAGRNVPMPDIDRIAGPTITAVPVRVRIEEDENTQGFVRRLQTQHTEMIPFQHAGLQNISRLSPDARVACSFQTMITINPSNNSTENTTLGTLLSDEGSANFYTYPLLLEFGLSDDDVEIKVTYDEAVIDRLRMKRMLLQLGHVLRQITVAPEDHCVKDISLISLEERAELREKQKVPPKLETCVHHMVEKQVMQQFRTVAVESWDGSLTFSQLDTLSTRVACYLQRVGVQPNTIIPICFEKSMWAVVAMLAVAKSGAAFVALDPSQPFERLQLIVNTVNARVMISSEMTSRFCHKMIEDVIVLNDTTTKVSFPDGTLRSMAKPSSMFYVVFTSGSTGMPKGVVIDHAAYASVVAGHGESMHIGHKTRVLQYSSYAFDASILEIMSTLALGGCVCIPSNQERTDDVIGAMNRMQVHLAIMTPSVADFLSPDDVPSLETLVLGGEAMKPAHVKIWSDRVQLVNAFGPSECSVVIVVNSNVTPTTNPANIGHPVGVACWVVEPEDHDRLVPFGTVGELLVEGPTVARGYYEEPEKTAAVFIRDPAWASESSEKSRRFYKTGDLVRWNSDFTLTFIGRKDTQVKIRGQRTELGEIENALGSHEDVKHNVVMLPKSGPCSNRLTALVCLHSAAHPELPAPEAIRLVDSLSSPHLATKLTLLRSHISSHLPAYMVPQLWFVIEMMPLMPTGKIDRAQLTKWLTSMTQETYQFSLYEKFAAPKRLPQNDLEEKASAIVADVLGIEASSINMNTSFLAHGGDSISAMRVMRELKIIGISVSVLEILGSESLSELYPTEGSVDDTGTPDSGEWALSTDTEETDILNIPVFDKSISDVSLGDVPLLSLKQKSFEDLVRVLTDHNLAGQGAVEDIYAVSPMQKKLLQSQLICSHFYQSRTLFEISSSNPHIEITPGKVRSAWEMVVECHPILRTVFLRDGATEQFSQAVLRNIEPNFLEVQHQPPNSLIVLTDLPEVGLQDCILSNRLAVCQTSPTTFLCRFDINHALVDGPSLHKMLQDLTLAMDAQPLTLAPKYSEFISHIQNRDIGTHLDYWRGYLARLVPCRIHIDPKPHEDYRFVSIQLLHNEKLKRFCRRSAITLSSLLRSIWGLILRHFIRQDSVSFGYLVSARNLPVEELNQIVGPLLSVLPCHFKAEGGSKLVNVLRDMQLDSIQSLDHEGVSLPQVCASLDIDENALFNTIVNFRQFDHSTEDDQSRAFLLKDKGGLDPMNYDMILAIDTSSNGDISAHVNYWFPRITDAWANDMAAAFTSALNSVVTAQSDAIVEDLDFALSSEE